MSDETIAVHDLKVWPEFFAALATGRKTFEVRKDDRGFREGDRLILREWHPTDAAYTGAHIEASIGYVLRGGQFGIEDGYVVLALTGPDLERRR